MEIIKNFGINPYLLSAQIINFLILMYLLKRFAFKPIMQMIAARKATIEEGLKSARESMVALDNALEAEKKILKNAQSNAEKILTDAKNDAQSIVDIAKKTSQKQVEQMLQDAHEKMDTEGKEIEKRIALSTAKLAVNMVQDAISGVFSEKEQEVALKKLTANLEKITIK